MTFKELAQTVLLETKIPMNPKEIWEHALKKDYDKLLGSKGKTPIDTISAQLHTDKFLPNSVFSVTATRPKKFFLKEWAEQSEVTLIQINDKLKINTSKSETENILNQISYSEKDLHKFLTYFAFQQFKCYCKTISHSKSGKGEYGEWVHPDMVGCSFQFNDWRKEVVEFSKATGNVIVKVYSFELKKELNFSNIRESFFQAVSNSSWANEGYLVAANILDSEDFIVELRRLSSSFGIGIISLNVREVDSSDILFQAKSREIIDWQTVNKLASMNPDFQEFMNRVSKDIHANEVYKEKYDKVFKKEDLVL